MSTRRAASAPSASTYGSVWRFLTSARLAVALFVLLILANLLILTVPQVPPELSRFSEEYVRWMMDQRERYGSLSGLFESAGLYAIPESLWFQGLLAILTLQATLCAVSRLRATWRTIASPQLRVSEGFFDRARFGADLTLADSTALQRALMRRGYAIKRLVQGQTTYLYGDRNAWTRLGTFVGHLSLIIIVAGAVLSNAYAFERQATIAEGMTEPMYPVRHPEQIQFRNLRSVNQNYEDGSPRNYETELVLYKGGREVKRGITRVNEPLSYDGYTFHQRFLGPAAELEIKDARGGVLVSETVALKDSYQNVPVGYLLVPTTPYFLVVGLMPAEGSGIPTLTLFGYNREDTSRAAFNLSLTPGEGKATDGLSFSFVGPRQFASLVIRRDPGAPLIWVGAALFLAALGASLSLPRRRLWARVIGNEVRLAGNTEHMVNLQPEIDSIMAEVQAVPEGLPAAKEAQP